MTNQNIANVVIAVLNEVELDGEMMEYIIDKVGMRDQMIKQLVTAPEEIKSQNDDSFQDGIYTFTEGELIEYTQVMMDQALDAATNAIHDSGVDMESYVELDIYDRNIEVSVDDKNIYDEIISNVKSVFDYDEDSIKDQMNHILDHLSKA